MNKRFTSQTSRPRALLGLLVTSFMVCLGCGGNSLPPQADPVRAQEVLQTTLETWKRGGSPGELASRKPPIRVVDRDWQEGLKIVEYRLAGEGQRLGLNMQCPVELTLKDANGKAVQKRVTYVVSTGETDVVSRLEADF